MSYEGSTFFALLELADKYCGPIGVGKELVLSLFQEQSDWAFIIQIDALHETACRDIIARLLTLETLSASNNEDMAGFVNSLSFQGRTSIIGLLKMTGIPKDLTDFVDVVRTIRNAFAHDIRDVSKTLLEIIQGRNDHTRVLKILSYVEQFDEQTMVELIKEDPATFRFVILQQCLTFLYLIHINLRDREEGAKLAGEA